MLRSLQAVVFANWNAQQEVERNAEAILTTTNGGVLMDEPQRQVWEDYFYAARDHRRLLRSQYDEIDTAIWRWEKAMAASDDTLQDWYANARTTSGECGGHKKAERNEQLAAAWLGALQVRGLRPDGRKGQFNGDGAS
jgi:hypothetical protein